MAGKEKENMKRKGNQRLVGRKVKTTVKKTKVHPGTRTSVITIMTINLEL